MHTLFAAARGATNACSPEDDRELIHHESITCPHCWETIEIALDLSVEEQRYVEDCSVCCRPIMISYRAGPDGLTELDAQAEGSE
jgi:hypothetical protein